MAVPKILLYYVFTPLSDPESIRLWQRDLCERLGLRGRIIVSKHGINGTVGGDIDACKMYVRRLREYPAFKDVDMKWSDGTGLDADGYSLDFPRLSVKARDEIVSFGAPEQLQVDEAGVIGGGKHLKPEELHELLAEKPDAVFFDGRNAVEAEVGRFKGAIVPNTDTTHDFITEIESGKYDDLKDKPVVTYCTGGVRCEVLSALMIERGFNEVYQLDGGIVRYGERFGNDGLWEGSLTVFDAREHIDFAPNPKVIGRCHRCEAPTARLQNCDDPACRERLVTCEGCADQGVACQAHAPSLAE
ncbi:oxygen-dependent tRNA uridine(34) hydroxylase TrhO [Gulosibacter chungangensis]|uniref:tRNA uridine(34) hydroxylase n=1 Tax=Gulosibacter chungangensis TaxID=979746 RepID=A0A7J5BAA4_9MICO|nr:rhodanese-related sulfurtransferase [Gulosibacter chungangensis]KAB1642698.1 rhodanese-related sulfurtransferase [Gulosibacter chungangensis]